MTRAKKVRQQRQQAAAPPAVRRKGERRKASRKVLVGAAIVVLVIVGAGVGIALAVGGGNSSSTVPTLGSLTNALPGAADAQRLFRGIPQHGDLLGSPTAPATMIEYIDLQCPHCRDFETTVMPTIVQRFVRNGKLKVVSRPVAIIGPDSIRGAKAAIAAGQQNRMFDFSQVTYFNQGVENTGWLNDAFVKQAAASVPGMDVPRLASATGSTTVSDQARQYAAQANAARIPGTPALFVGRSGGRLQYVPNFGTQALSAEIQRALG